MAHKKTQCPTCDELAERRMWLGREYSRALNQAMEARYTYAFAGLSESADIAHRRFQNAASALKEHWNSGLCGIALARMRNAA